MTRGRVSRNPGAAFVARARRSGAFARLMLAAALSVLPVDRASAAKDTVTSKEMAAIFEAAAAKNSHYCAIVLVQDGKIGPNPENTELTSRSYGGRPGEADVIATNSSFELSIDPVLGFSSAPAGADSGTTFTPSYSGNGATGFSETPWNVPVRLKNGTTRVLVNLSALNPENGFPAGNYQADVTLRCE